MNKYTVTVIKTGNSYALRVPKKYIDDSELILGQKVQVGEPLIATKPHNKEAIQRAIKNLRKINAFATVTDPVAWQKDIRTDRPLPGRD